MKTIVTNKMQIFIGNKEAKAIRRTKYDVWNDVLDSCLETQRTKFWLASRLKLSWKVVNEALDFLKTKRLVEISKHPSGKIMVKTTLKGQEAVKAYKLLIKNYYFVK